MIIKCDFEKRATIAARVDYGVSDKAGGDPGGPPLRVAGLIVRFLALVRFDILEVAGIDIIIVK